jgi:cytochrome b
MPRNERPTQRDDTELAPVPVPVWDLPVRVVHWVVVLLLVGLIATGLAGNEWLEWHFRFGQAMLALVAFRVIWGFTGSRNARFAAFVRRPQRVAHYARSIARGAKELHATHNPLGGWMVVALLVALLVQAGTGLFANDDILWEGPLAARVAKDTSDAFSWFHRRFWWLLVALSLIHIGAVLAYFALLKDNLIVPMLTGRKRLPPGAADPAHAAASTTRALVLIALCGILVWYGFNKLAPLPG